MSGIFGALGINDTDRVFLQTLGQTVVYEAVQMTLEQYNADLAGAMELFVEEVTSDFKRRYKLPGGGRLQRLGGQARAGTVKATGQWDVAFPLEGFGGALASNRVDYAYMSVQDLDRHLDTIFAQDTNTVLFEIFKALWNSNEDTFVDEQHGSLLVEPLANGDTVTFPPVLGSESEATENHYLESGYAASGISDSNNPYVTIRDELEEHFGTPTGGSNIVSFINSAQTAKTEALTDFDPVNDRFTTPGASTDQLFGLPTMPGRIVGRSNGVWIVEWRRIPSSWIFGLHLDAPKPLIMRIDPADTGLGSGLQLVAESDTHPFSSSHYEHRFGLGCGNRLNGVAFELGTGGTYTIPTAFQ